MYFLTRKIAYENENDCAENLIFRYCTSGSWMDKPVAVGVGPPGGCECPPEGGIGGQCQAGEYCPEGAYEPKPCDPGES